MIDEALQMPELPDAKIKRYTEELNVKRYDALVICAEKELAYYFEAMLATGASPKNAVNWLTTELLGRLKKTEFDITTSPVSAAKLGELVSKIDDGTISGKGAKEILDVLIEEDKDIDGLIDSMGLAQVSDDGAILEIIDGIIAANPEKVEQYKGGKEKLFGFFVGQTMKASKGAANPQKVNELLKERLS